MTYRTAPLTVRAVLVLVLYLWAMTGTVTGDAHHVWVPLVMGN